MAINFYRLKIIERPRLFRSVNAGQTSQMRLRILLMRSINDHTHSPTDVLLPIPNASRTDQLLRMITVNIWFTFFKFTEYRQCLIIYQLTRIFEKLTSVQLSTHLRHAIG